MRAQHETKSPENTRSASIMTRVFVTSDSKLLPRDARRHHHRRECRCSVHRTPPTTISRLRTTLTLTNPFPAFPTSKPPELSLSLASPTFLGESSSSICGSVASRPTYGVLPALIGRISTGRLGSSRKLRGDAGKLGDAEVLTLTAS